MSSSPSAAVTWWHDPLPRSGRLPRTVKVRLALEIVRAYVRVQWELAHGNLPATVERLRRHGPDPTCDLEIEEFVTAARLGRAVTRLLRYLPFDSRCLARSLVLTCLLENRGLPSVLVIGVRQAPRFAAHAWVETAGVPLLMAGGPSFQRLAEL